ncbi:hypothetical protein VAEKB19_1970011 [Vibrio aestuarianus]|nr:hypothetical protein VAEKB19_1970011 [Vibrio aestuarianus]
MSFLFCCGLTLICIPMDNAKSFRIIPHYSALFRLTNVITINAIAF